jgi:hypothetical protein
VAAGDNSDYYATNKQTLNTDMMLGQPPALYNLIDIK